MAVIAAASAVLLTGVSVWFLGAVALAGLAPAAYTFNFHFPSALVRLFALSRTAAKFGERFYGHRAALSDQVRRRAALFHAMAEAPGVRAAGWQLGRPEQLADYIDDVEDVDFTRLRVRMPGILLVAGAALLLVATAIVAPLAALPALAIVAAVALLTRSLPPRAARHWRDTRTAWRAGAAAIGSTLAAAVALRAERSWAAHLARGFEAMRTGEAARLEERRDLAWVDLAAGLAGPLAALCVLLAAWLAGLRGDALLIPAFVAFAWLAFGETTAGLSRLLAGHIHGKAAAETVAAWTAGVYDGSPLARPLSTPLRTIELRDLPRRAPDGRQIGGTLSLVLRQGVPTVLSGPSGVGKTSLLKQIAGWLGTDDAGRILASGRPLDASQRRQICHLGLHDAAVLADTVKENLFAADRTDEELTRALEAVELEGRIAPAGGLGAWIDQDVLSLGEAQRLNLARALLSPCPVILLDEPTEHLDAAQGARVLERVLARLADRIVVISTHRPIGADAGQLVDLQAAGRSPATS